MEENWLELRTAPRQGTYTYNDSGIRTSKIYNGVTTNYYLNGSSIVRQVTGSKILDFFYDENGNMYGFKEAGSMYYYLRNGQNDIIGILNSSGVQVVYYTYDSWGNPKSTTGTLATTIGVDNPFRYRGYYFDSDTGLYYLNSRYYDPAVERFINADLVIAGNGPILETALYTYCENNPVNFRDPSGYIIDTVFDVISIVWSFDSFVKEPNLLNFGFLAWDVGAALLPMVPGSYVAKGGQFAVKVASKLDDLLDLKNLTTGTYKQLRVWCKGMGVEVHHLIEKRFLKSKFLSELIKNSDDMLSIPMTKELHRIFTNKWREVVAYKKRLENMDELIKTIDDVYEKYPELLGQIKDWLKMVSKK
jgi:RHS repeat-associated protein